MANTQDILKRIQEEAKRRQAEVRKKFRLPAPAEAAPVIESAPDRPVVDVAAIAKKVAREYIGDVTEKFGEVAARTVQTLRADADFTTNIRDAQGRIALYPNNCKLLVEDDATGNGAIIIEEQPQLRTLFVGRGQVYRVPMPYIVFVIGYRRSGDRYNLYATGVGFGVKPINSVDDCLLTPRLPHIQGNRHLCQPVPVDSVSSVSELANAVVGVFWQSSFVYSWTQYNCDFKLKDGRLIDGFKAWERLGKNPLDILTADFGQGESLRDIIKSMGQTIRKKGTDYQTQMFNAVQRVLHEVGAQLDPNQLAEVIRKAVEQINNSALQQ